MASIQTRKRKDGTTAWRVVFRITPGGAPTTETFDTAHDAQNFARLVDRIGGKAAREKRDAATWDQALTFSEAFAHMRENAIDLTPGTLYDYERTLDRCGATARFGALSLDMIDHSDIQAWANERAKTVSKQTGKPLSPKTLRNELSIVSSVFSHAVREGWIESSPTAHTRLPKARRPSIRVLTFEEYAAILAEVREDQRPPVQFLATTGARWGEVTALEWGDLAQVSDEAWRVTIQRAWKRSERSGRKNRNLPPHHHDPRERRDRTRETRQTARTDLPKRARWTYPTRLVPSADMATGNLPRRSDATAESARPAPLARLRPPC